MTTLGTDIATPVSAEGLLDLDPTFALASGRAQLAQAIGRRITTRRGTLAWIEGDAGADYGVDVRDFLGSDLGSGTAFRASAAAQAELLCDERVRGADVTASVTDGLLTIVARVADADGPFRFVLAVSAVTIDLLRVTP